MNAMTMMMTMKPKGKTMIKNLGFDIYAIIDEMPAGFAGHKLTEFKTEWVANFHHFGRLYTIDAVFDLERDISAIVIADKNGVIVNYIKGALTKGDDDD